MTETILYEHDDIKSEFKSVDRFCVYDPISGEYLVDPHDWYWDDSPRKTGLFYSKEEAARVITEITDAFVKNGETKIGFEIIKCQVIESEIIRRRILKLD